MRHGIAAALGDGDGEDDADTTLAVGAGEEVAVAGPCVQPPSRARAAANPNERAT